MPEADPPIIYNLFPTLAGSLDRWSPHLVRAAEMGFSWLFLNPLAAPGFSGSLYATRDHLRLHPMLLPPNAAGDDLALLGPAVRQMRDLGLLPIADLVINHTSKDAPLVGQHPDWYVRDEAGEVVSPFAVDPDDPAKVTTWGDLAEIDNAASPDRDALWSFWTALVLRYLELGFAGFRCDAAYKVPVELWQHLVAAATRAEPRVCFFAETLGCTLEQALAVRAAGLHYFFNSSKWWDFQAPWALEQHQIFEDVPSISFPESHDTPRLAAESGGSEAVQRQRYAFAATYSAGVMLPVGYEFGFQRPLDVVLTTPADWEPPRFDLRPFVARVNRLKRATPLLHGEGHLELLDVAADDVTVIERRSARAPDAIGWILVNRRPDAPRAFPASFAAPGPARLLRPCRDAAPPDGEPAQPEITLDPAEVAVLVQSRDRSAGEGRGGGGRP